MLKKTIKGITHEHEPSLPGDLIRNLRWYFCLLCLWVPVTSWSDSFRCGRNLVRTGDTTQELIERCGEPQSRDYALEQFWSGGELRKTRVARWLYKSDGRRLERIVLIYQDEVIAVRTGERLAD
jgi:hypothetical protein